MRNLKRALSLALASVMLLGMMVVGSGASYADVTSEQNVEAIEVLQTIGVMVGDESGNFNPDKNVTRNEMAVIMANLMDYRVATYAGTSPFTDVPSWAEPYVAACWTNGITSGTSATTYGGDSTVTTAQAALMLMKALGYFQFASDFGNDWQLATVSQANKIDLLNDVEAGVREAMTRNDVAQLVLNTLKSGMVEADDDTLYVNADGVTVEAGKVNYLYVTSRESYARAIKQDLGASANSVNNLNAPIVDLGEKLYQGDLKMDEGTRDDFGRPGTTWRYKTNDIGTYAEDPIAVYTTKVTKGELWSLIGRSNVDALGNTSVLSVYANGYDVVAPVKANYFANNSTGAAGVANTTGEAGKGVVTEVYLDNDGNVSIVYVNTYLAQVSGDYNESKGTLNTTTITNPAGFTLGVLDSEDFDNLSEFKDEDYILYTVARGDVKSIAKAQVVTGEVGSYTLEESVTLDGTKYEYGKNIEAVDPDDSKYTEFVVGAPAAVVLDQYGYVLYVDDASLSVGNYVYVAGVVSKSGTSSSQIAKAYFSDGTCKDVDIDKMYDNTGAKLTISGAPSSINGASAHNWDGWYSFSEDNGLYTLRGADSNVGPATITGNGAEKVIMYSERVGFLNSTNVGFSANGNDDTIFIVDDGNDVNVYTGIKNAPDIKLTASATASDSVVVSLMKVKDSTTGYASLVFVDASGVTTPNGIVIDGGSQELLMYVLDKDSTYVDKKNGDKINRYNVVLDGEAKTVDTKDTWSTYTMYTKVKQDSNGYYKAETFAGAGIATQLSNAYSNAVVDYSNGTLNIGGYTYVISSDTKITLVLQDVKADGTKENSNNLGKYDPANGQTVVMTDASKKYEVETGISGRNLEGRLSGYHVDGSFYGFYTDSTSNELKSLVIVVTEAI